MHFWSLYFFAKLVLYAGGHLGFDAPLNFAFAIYTALPATNARLRLAKNLLGAPLALVLLYHDSWLPPLPRLLAATPALADFSAEYLWELAQRLVDVRAVAALAVLLAAYLLLRRKLRLGSFAFVAILLAWVLPAPGAGAPDLAPRATAAALPADAAPPGLASARAPEDLERALHGFYEREASRRVEWPAQAGDPPFDLLILHLCSLSWDDLDAAGLGGERLLQRFDLLLTRFGTAASYSGPAAIRLLRGACGQVPHGELYGAPDPRCLLIGGLERLGFEPHWLMNHDGRFGNFFADVRLRGGLEVAPDAADGPATLRAFDGTPIRDDYAVLSHWWARRLARATPREVLYYNSITLHDGNRLVAAPGLAGLDSYRARARQLLSGLDRFLDDLARSGRRVVVVVVPEHGAAVRGDAQQLPGLREIPTPAIATVPVGIVALGGRAARAPTLRRLSEPVSYLALTEFLARIAADSPFASDPPDLAGATRDLPRTPFVAENDGTIVLEAGGAPMLRTPGGDWSPLPR